MKKNMIILPIVVALIVGVIAFFGGMQYQKSQRMTFGGQFAGMGNGQRGMMFQGSRQGMQGIRPVMGEIIGQDDKSITVKMQDGSTKIIILSDKTTINKASEGSKSDLKVGERVSIFGTQNADGSVTAQNVSLGGMFRGMGKQASPSGQPVNNQ